MNILCKSDEIRQKSKDTSIKNYGCEYPMQNATYAEKMFKAGYKYKDYIYPSGKVIKIQGYEHLALNELIQYGLTDEDIITERTLVPEIWYTDTKDKKHRYYVDIYIPSQNLTIEVKSTWTFQVKHDIIMMKYHAMKNAGYQCEIWVYNEKGVKVERV